MSAINPQRVNSHASRGNVSQTVTRFVDAIEELAVELNAPEPVVSEVVDAGEEMADIVEETAQQSNMNAAEIDDNAEQIDDNTDEIENNTEQIEQVDESHGANIAGCHARISSVEDDVAEVEAQIDDQPRGSEVGDNHSTAPETSLEHVVGLDEAVVEENLTSNQQRARHVAQDPRHYGERTGQGWMLTSGDVSKVLRSGTDCEGRTQTVSRVMDFLDRLGDDEVEVTTRRGTRRVYFSEEIAERLTEINGSDNTVVTTEPVEGVI